MQSMLPVFGQADRRFSVLAIRHLAFEDLGAFAPAMEMHGGEIRYLDAGVDRLDESLLMAADVLVVLGGPIGAYEDDRYPFLRDELRALEKRLAQQRPTMGICLGAQLMARALGARVYPSGHREIGFAPIRLTPAGRRSCLAPFAEDPITLHWHGDTFDLPDGAEHLAATALCHNQAFSIGSHAIGFQFHPEAGGPGFERWLIGHAHELGAAHLDVRRLRDEALRHGPALAAKAGATLHGWLDSLTT